MNQKEQVRVRIAPSPTGPLHLGTVRTALFNYLFAKQHKGIFVLRIEDTDKERSEVKYEKDIIDNLKWLNLNWDEGPIKQSERTAIYKPYIQKLLDSNQAFYCYHSKEDLEAEKNEQMASGLAPKHVCCHASNKPDNDKKGIIRFRCAQEKVSFNDLIRGKLEFDCNLLGDISIAKDLETPLYHLTVVVDDAQMKISHVIRGEDHISNTPKQILLQRALGLPTPKYAHLPLMLGTDKSKMSKRHGAISAGYYKDEGYLPQAMINFIALLGWNPGTEKEIFSMDELIKEFSLEHVQKGGAIFNLSRLDWFNGSYIRKMDLEKLTRLCLPYLIKDKLIGPDGQGTKEDQICPPDSDHPQSELQFENYLIKDTNQNTDFNCLKRIVGLEQDRLRKLSQISELTQFFFKGKLDYEKELLIWKKMSLDQVKNSLNIVSDALSKMVKFDQNSLEQALMPIAKEHGTGELLWPLRVALSGHKASPGPFEIASVLGKEKTLKRVNDALDKLK